MPYTVLILNGAMMVFINAAVDFIHNQ